jgi:hypothetical protein
VIIEHQLQLGHTSWGIEHQLQLGQVHGRSRPSVVTLPRTFTDVRGLWRIAGYTAEKVGLGAASGGRRFY